MQLQPLEHTLHTTKPFKPLSEEEKDILDINEDNPMYDIIRFDRVQVYMELLNPELPQDAYIDEEHRKSFELSLMPKGHPYWENGQYKRPYTEGYDPRKGDRGGFCP